MALSTTKIEDHSGKSRAGLHKKMKKQRNKKIRRVPKDQIPNTKEYKDYEF